MIPNMRPDGTLPPGRWGTTLPDVETTFVSGRDPVRAEIMQDFINALQLLRRVTPVSRVWIGGSFTTSKTTPSDIDAVFIIRSDHIERAQTDTTSAAILQLYTGAHRLMNATGLRVDAYMLAWELDGTGQGLAAEYLRWRGYWDDFWERSRSGPKSAAPVDSDAYQRRGYLEVIIDGNS